MKLRRVSADFDILLSEESQRSRNRPTILVGRKVYYRFMDVLYVPDHVYRLPPEFVAELNRIRDELSGFVIDAEYNEVVYRGLLVSVRESKQRLRSILDFGCGRGAAGDYIHAAFPAAKIYGFDIRPIDTLPPYTDIVTGGADDRLPFPDDSFDLCLAFFVFHFRITDFQLSELCRILRPQGILAFNLINSADFEVLDRVHERGFSLRDDVELESTSNAGRGFIFVSDKVVDEAQ
jgi:SAM-dependent methyltransferase